MNKLSKKIAPFFCGAIFGFGAMFKLSVPRSVRARLTLPLLSIMMFSSTASTAPVVDISEHQAGQNQGQNQNQSQGADPQRADEPADMFYQMQILQEEIRQLRGMLEQQSYQLRQLKQRQTENYNDLDGRLSGLTTVAASGGVSTGSGLKNDPRQDLVSGELRPVVASQETTSTSGNSGSSDVDQESARYNAAYALLKARKLDESLVAFQNFITAFPAGSYTPNAYYWMGEIYLVGNRFDEAVAEFSRVVENYPAHRKALDARYKLGTVYFQKGDKEKARKHLETAAAGNGSGARLAQRYLEAHF